MAAPLGVVAHGDRQRHPRAAGVPGADGGSAVGEPRHAAALLRRVRAALRARRAATGARARHPPRRRRTRRAPARRDRPGYVGSSSRHQCDGNVDPSVPPVLPRNRAFPRSPAARRRLRVGRRVRRQARRHRRGRRLGSATARRDLARRRHVLDDAPRTAVDRRGRFRPPRAKRRDRRRRGTGTPGPPAGQRDLGHRHALDPVGAGGTGARRAGAASDVRVDRGVRRAHARRVVHRGRRDPLGHRIPARGRPPRSPEAANSCRRVPGRRHAVRSTSRGCSSSATGLRSRPWAPTARVERPCSRSSPTGRRSSPRSTPAPSRAVVTAR